jgi:co-chaperonin GroES (HSP10)
VGYHRLQMHDPDDVHGRFNRSLDATSVIEPLDEWLTIEPATEETETAAGLIIPAHARSETPVRAGIVLACGDEVQGIRPGDKVLVLREGAMEVKLGGQMKLLVRRDAVVARYTD